MPTLSLTVSDEVATRLRTAYQVDTNAQLKAAIIQQIKSVVHNAEQITVSEAEDAKVQAVVDAKQTALETLASEIETNVAIS